MYPLVESIKIVDGNPKHLKWHQQRFERSYQRYYGKKTHLKISDAFSISEKYSLGLVKGRFLYNKASFTWDFHHYIPRKIKTLKIVHDNQINYDLKYVERGELKKLYKQRGECDGILIIKNGYITDTYFANIAFFTGEKWLTPSTPLLEGTCRARLLQEGKIFEDDIKLHDLQKYKKFKLINAMLGFKETEALPIFTIKE